MTVAYEYLEKQFLEDELKSYLEVFGRIICVCLLWFFTFFVFLFYFKHQKYIPAICWGLYFIILFVLFVHDSHRKKMNAKAASLSTTDYEKYLSLIDKYDELRRVRYGGRFIHSEYEKTIKELILLVYDNEKLLQPLICPEEAAFVEKS